MRLFNLYMQLLILWKQSPNTGPRIAPVHCAAGSNGETNFGVASLAAPKADEKQISIGCVCASALCQKQNSDRYLAVVVTDAYTTRFRCWRLNVEEGHSR
jgi:hypothetical protein